MADDNQAPQCKLLGCKNPCSSTGFDHFDLGCCEFHTLIIKRRDINQQRCLLAGCKNDRDYKNGHMGCCKEHEQALELPNSPYDRRSGTQKYSASKLHEKGG